MEMAFVILEKARGLAKIKVPIRLRTGKIVYGYRWKGKKTIKKKSESLAKVPVIESVFNTADYVSKFVRNGFVNIGLLGSKEDLGWVEEQIRNDIIKKPNERLKLENEFRKLREDVKLSDIFRRMNVKAVGFKEMKDELAKREIKMSRDWYKEWATSGRFSEGSLWMQYEVARRLNKPEYFTWKELKDAEKLYEKQSEILKKEVREVVNLTYRRTQKIFRELGFKKDDEVWIYRGLKLTDGAVLKKGKILEKREFRHAPLSSWSFSPRVAAEFGATVLAAKVKVKDLFAVWHTGFGCKEESECVVIADKIKRIKVIHTFKE